MARLNSSQLQQLLMQAKFAPEKKRLQQLDACEALVHLIQPGCEYPFEFICFHLTGYRPHSGKDFQTDNLLSYNELLSHIPAYAGQLSNSMRIPACSITQKVYTIDSLARRFRVCQKTISRWRQKGLVGRYLVFSDGRARLAFKDTSVDFFVRNNRRKVSQGKKFSQITDIERQAISDRLERWSQHCPSHRQEAIRRTARKFNRSAETIRTILNDAETNNYKNIQFKKRLYSIPLHQRQEIYKQYQNNVPIFDLMKRFNRSRTNIYRAINIEKAVQLLGAEISYMHSPDFDDPGVQVRMLEPEPELFTENHTVNQNHGSKSEEKRLNQNSINTYMNDIHQTPLLTAAQEKFLFRRYNYLKYLADQLHKNINRKEPSGRTLSQIRSYLHKAKEDKDRLIRSNLRLVVSTARRHAHNESEMSELIGEGNMALMNSVEKFDYNRGVKLSTYATWAIIKKYATLRSQQNRRPIYEATDELLEVAHDMRVQDNKVLAVESARMSLEDVMTETLEDRERTIVKEHYGLIKQTEITGQRKAKSLRQIAELLGLSKERVRKIELFALQKLRKVLTREQFDLLIQG